MVLEPLSAFGVACNVIQIIEVGFKVLSTASEYRKAADGVLNEQKELREVARTIQNLSTTLQASLSGATSSTASPEESRLLEANNECLRVSEDFLNLLDRLKVRNRQSTIESLQMSIKTRWYKDRIGNVQNAVVEARNNLNVAFLVYMHSKQTAASNHTDTRITDVADKTEQNLLAAVNSSSASTQDEIRKLAEQLKETYLDSDSHTAVGFMNANQDVLDEILEHLKAILASQNHVHSVTTEDRTLEAQHRILNSLRFDQIYDRQEQVHTAYSSTYQWMLQPLDQNWQNWDCFSTWLKSSRPRPQLYWIHGKPGSGKSTVMKFLENRLFNETHMNDWSQGMLVLKACCYFWAPGTPLQKSLRGLYRSLLFQLLEQDPGMVSRVVPLRKWKTAEMSGPLRSLEWTNSELRNTLEDLVHNLRRSTKVFLLIDGLDEFEGSNDEQEYLVNFLCELSRYENIKICVSSRPLNVFQDHLSQYPQLRLEDLTRKDIALVISSNLEQSTRFQFFERLYPNEARDLVLNIINKADGVFLWVRLVTNDLLKGLRDGDSLSQVQEKLNRTPADLDKYFLQIIDSIQPQHRREASMMLQLALHRETEFVSLRPFSLSDILFVEELREDFAVAPEYNRNRFSIKDRSSMIFGVDSAFRRLNSRCMGLLEFVHNESLCDCVGDYHADLCIGSDSMAWRAPGADLTATLEGSTHTILLNLLRSTRVEFFHRTLRDFLLTPDMQNHLHHYTGGAVDARVFLCSAGIVQFIALVDAGIYDSLTTLLASHLLSALSVNRNTATSAGMADAVATAIEQLASNLEPVVQGWWYIDASLETYHEEESNFLTVAIDFRLTSYVLSHITPAAIKDKVGRPVLDYILIPRFINYDSISINNRFPDIEMVEAALRYGADPNETYGVVTGSVDTIWSRFLCLCRDALPKKNTLRYDRTTSDAFLLALRVLLRNGADVFLTEASLSKPKGDYHHIDSAVWTDQYAARDRFVGRWPGLGATYSRELDGKRENLYTVSSILAYLHSFFEPGLSDLMQESQIEEDKHSNEITSIPGGFTWLLGECYHPPFV